MFDGSDSQVLAGIPVEEREYPGNYPRRRLPRKEESTPRPQSANTTLPQLRPRGERCPLGSDPGRSVTGPVPAVPVLPSHGDHGDQ